MMTLRDSIRSFIYGFTLPLQALRLIFQKKKLLSWSIIPVVLTLALSIWGVAYVKGKIVAWGIHELATRGYEPGSIAVQAMLVFLQIVLFILAAVSFSFFAGIIAAPFNDFLAEAAEPFTTPPLPPAQTGLRGKVRAFLIDVVKTTVITSLQIGLIFIGVLGFWLPGLNLIPFAAAFWLLAFQFVSYPQTRREEGLKDSVRFLFRHAFATFGFGTALGFLFPIPVVSSLALPLAVVGGTLLYARAQATTPPLFRLR